MIPHSLVLKVTIKGVSSRRIWDTQEPMTLGHPIRWVLERNGGEICIRHVSPRSLKKLADGTPFPDEVPAHEKGETSIAVKIDEAKFSNGHSIVLPRDSSALDSATLEFRTLSLFPLAHTIPCDSPSRIRVYGSRGDWTFDSKDLESCYTGTVGKKRAFQVEKVSERSFKVTSLSDDLKIRVSDRNESVMSKTTKDFSFDELVGITIMQGALQWRFQAVSEPQLWNAADADSQRTESEIALLRQTRKTAGGILLAFALLALIWPKPKTPDPQMKDQVVQLLLKKPTPAAAAQGDLKAKKTSVGHKKSPSPRGTESSKNKVAKKTTVPKISASKEPRKSATAKQVAKRELRRPTPVARAQPKPVASATEKKPASRPKQAAAPSKTHASNAAPKIPVKAALTSPSHSLAQVLGGSAFQAASKNVLRGGMNGGLFKPQRYESDVASRSDSRTMTSNLEGVNTKQGLGSQREVQVSTLGASQEQSGVKGPGYGKGSHAAISGQGRSFVSMDTSESDVEGGLSRDQVNAVVRQHMDQIRYCYEAARLRSLGTQGKLGVKFTIGSNGSVQRSDVEQSTVGDVKLDACVLKHLVTWKFPRSRNNFATAASYPFIFKALAR